jgi:ribosomal protein S18 acetylase RimI-like enzyme
MAIREASTADIAGIRAVAEASWEHDYPATLSKESVTDGFEDWYGVERLESELADPKTQVFVYRSDDEVRGFVHAVVDGRDGVILRLYVHPEHREHEIASQLITHVESTLESYDVDRIRAMVLADNTVANEFYRGLGFEKISEGTTRIGDVTYAENVYEQRR